jgi:hypothetical protein
MLAAKRFLLRQQSFFSHVEHVLWMSYVQATGTLRGSHPSYTAYPQVPLVPARFRTQALVSI